MEELPLITAFCCLYPLTEIALRPVINVFKLKKLFSPHQNESVRWTAGVMGKLAGL